MSKQKHRKHNEKPLTEQQKKAVAMLYDYERVKDVASALGVHRSTIWRWGQLRGFRREWNRIDRNLRRKYERREVKRRAEEDAYWDQKLKEAEENLHKLSENITKMPGKSWYKAWDAYEKAMCRGRSLAELFDVIFNEKHRRFKRRRS